MVPTVSAHLTKTSPLGSTKIRQDFEKLAETQIKESLMKPLQKIGSVERIRETEFQKRKVMEQGMAQNKKKKAEQVCDLQGMLKFLKA